MVSSIQAFVVDNQPLFCVGIQAVVEMTEDIQLLGSAASFNEYCTQYEKIMPDLLLLEAIPGGFSFEAISNWKEGNKNTQILAMVCHSYQICLRKATSHGVAGCILKTDAPERFIQAVRAVAGGEEWFSRQLLHQTVKTQILAMPEPVAAHLSEQEKEILQLLCAEKGNADIAADLHVSERTICRYLEDIYMKLGVRSRLGAAVQATRMGLA